MATTILDVSKKIIRKAAEIGLDQAGSLLLPGSWKYFKLILMPIIKELEKKYPKLLLVNADKPNPDNQKALDSLEHDEHLQQLLKDRFARLSTGQDKIYADIQQIDLRLKKIGQSIEDLGEMTQQRFNEVMEAVNRNAGEQSPGKLNVIDVRVTNIKDERKNYVDFYVSNVGGSQVIIVKVNFKVLRTARAELIKAFLQPSGEYNLEISGLERAGDTITCPVSQSIDPGKSDLFRIILTAVKLKAGVFAAWELQPELVTNYGNISTEPIEIWLPFKDTSFSELEKIQRLSAGG